MHLLVRIRKLKWRPGLMGVRSEWTMPMIDLEPALVPQVGIPAREGIILAMRAGCQETIFLRHQVHIREAILPRWVRVVLDSTVSSSDLRRKHQSHRKRHTYRRHRISKRLRTPIRSSIHSNNSRDIRGRGKANNPGPAAHGSRDEGREAMTPGEDILADPTLYISERRLA